jgi:hypothetical protein
MPKKQTEENPAISDLAEMDVLRFLFELKREQIDPSELQKMLLQYKIQNQVKKLAEETNARGIRKDSPMSPHSSSSSSGGYSSTPSTSRTMESVPSPKVVFKSEPSSASSSKKSSKTKEDLQEREKFINLQPETSPDSDTDQENLSDNSQFTKLAAASKLKNWVGSSIYYNLPELVMAEFDRMLRDSHDMKVEVIETLNKESPVSYDYNPKKSRIRTNYADQQVADDRTRNNVASRRSRQRKKFQNQMVQYSVDFDLDENFLMAKQEKWLKGIISNLEQNVIAQDDGLSKLRKMRRQCGFE